MALIGMGAASAPLAAKIAQDAAFGSDLMPTSVGRVSGGDRRSFADNTQYGDAPAPLGQGPVGIDPFVAAETYVKTFGIPAHIEAQIREGEAAVYNLDPDIAAKRSWSMCVKIVTQRQRNIQRALDKQLTISRVKVAADAFQKLVGFRWPWSYY